jgi:acyl phosphate:glycerol-3-phosphate acyltransferase
MAGVECVACWPRFTYPAAPSVSDGADSRPGEAHGASDVIIPLMLELGIKSLAAYLLGSLLGGLILGRLRGVDIRHLGSGNAGATNALRTQGKLFALAVLLIDAGKGVLAVKLLPPAAWPAADPAVSREWLILACALGVIVGHVYPVWFSFRGGKGVATMVGVIGAVEPRLLLPVAIVWVAVLVLTGYVGLASMLAGAALVAFVRVAEPGNLPLLTFFAAIELFVIFTHRANIVRMVSGTEHRVRKVWLFRSRTA